MTKKEMIGIVSHWFNESDKKRTETEKKMIEFQDKGVTSGVIMCNTIMVIEFEKQRAYQKMLDLLYTE